MSNCAGGTGQPTKNAAGWANELPALSKGPIHPSVGKWIYSGGTYPNYNWGDERRISQILCSKNYICKLGPPSLSPNAPVFCRFQTRFHDTLRFCVKKKTGVGVPSLRWDFQLVITSRINSGGILLWEEELMVVLMRWGKFGAEGKFWLFFFQIFLKFPQEIKGFSVKAPDLRETNG